MDKEGNNRGVRFFENHFKTNNKKTLDPDTIDLDIYSTYNQIIEEKYVNKIQQSKNVLYGGCNTVVSVIKEKGKLGTLDTWTNPEGVYNIIYLPILEKFGYQITSYAKEQWVIYNP